MPAKKQKPDKPTEKLSSKQYENLGRIVASVYETGYLDAAKSYKNSFIKGVLGGFGGVIGATVVVALVLWVLSFFNQYPFINKIEDTINTTQNK